MDLRPYIFAGILGYLFGSIPFALVIGKIFYKTDVRKFGSGNLGATNAGRVLGKNAAVSVTILDALKAFLAMAFLFAFKQAPEVILVGGLFTTIGHSFPIFAEFKGGKSVATWYGFMLGVCVFITGNYWPFFLAVLVFASLLYFTETMSLASMVSTTVGSILSFFFVDGRYVVSGALLIVALFIIYRHKDNIKRIQSGTERKITWLRQGVDKIIKRNKK